MTLDGRTGVGIEYNILNLPSRIFANADTISYIYDASGTKLATVAVDGSLTLYRTVMTYARRAGQQVDELQYVVQPEGLVAPLNGSGGQAWEYRYFKTDHTGSTRVVLAASGAGPTASLTAVQTTDYYPFGMAHGMFGNLDINRYLYGGKEYQDAILGGSALGLYDFHARYYDPVLGRWFNVDPALQLVNPYLYAGNSPMMYVDKDGKFFISILIGAAISTLVNGIDNAIHDRPFFENGLKSAIIGGIGGGFSFGIGEAAQAFKGFGKIAFQTLAHGHLGGMMSGMSGGSYGSGFLSGGLGSLAATGSGALLKNAGPLARTAGMIGTGALMGGVGAEIAGGKFWDGFRNGAISSSLNHVAHGIRGEVQQSETEKAWEEFKEWCKKAEVAADMFGMWAAGVGPDDVLFDNDFVANALIDSPGIQKAVEEYYATGKTTGHYDFGAQGLIDAGLDPIKQFIGSYDYAITPVNGELHFTVTNQTSFASFVYHLTPYSSNWTNGPMGNFNQTYKFVYR